MAADKDILQMSDEELVERIVKDNDTRFFEVLYDRYSNRVYHRCLRFVKSEVEAQDITHDIFIKLFMKLKTFAGNSKFSTWFFSLTYNHCLNYVNRDKKNTIDSIDVNTISDDIQDEVSDEEIFSLTVERLNRALNIIDDGEKLILMMKYQDDLSVKEIMKVLSIGESAVKMRLSRAKQSLLKAYKKQS